MTAQAMRKSARSMPVPAGVKVEYSDTLPADTYGVTDFARRTITLAAGTREVEERCTLTHELIHLERGPVARSDSKAEELLVEVLSITRLLSIGRLMRFPSLVERFGEEEAAAAVGIDLMASDMAVRLARFLGGLLDGDDAAEDAR